MIPASMYACEMLLDTVSLPVCLPFPHLVSGILLKSSKGSSAMRFALSSILENI